MTQEISGLGMITSHDGWEVVKDHSEKGDVSVLVSEKEKGYLIGEFAKTLMKEVPQCRKRLRQLPM